MTASVRYTVAHPDNRVEWQLWSVAGDDATLPFVKVFGEAVDALAAHAQFTPYMMVRDGRLYGCTHNSCGSQCTNSQLYCHSDPDGDVNSGLSGQDIVREHLRQMCLFQVLNVTGRKVEQWWEYAKAFDKECNTVSEYGEACSYREMRAILGNGIQGEVQNCIAQSGGSGDNDGKNKIFDNIIKQAVKHGIQRTPALLVNNALYRGSMRCSSPLSPHTCGPLSMICGGFMRGSEPPACTGDIGCHLGVSRDSCGMCGGPADHPDMCNDGVVTTMPVHGASAGTIFGVGILIAIVVGLGVFAYMRAQQARMRTDIDSLLRQYLPIDAANQYAADQGVPDSVRLMRGQQDSSGTVQA